MALDLSSSSEPDLSSSKKQGDTNEPSSLKAWGRKVSTYYEEGDEEESESLDGELEEKEALHLQALHATLLSQNDFDIQISGNRSPLEDVEVCSVVACIFTFVGFMSAVYLGGY